MLKRTKFVVVSNMRAGSTWLATTLGAFPDAATDFEIKWNVNYPPHKIHCVLNHQSPLISQILDEFSEEFVVVGSKFVFDPVELTHDDYDNLRKKFDNKLKIIHLVRRYRDIFLSARRGFFHQLNEATPRRIGEHLRAGFDTSRPEKFVKPSEPARISPAACYEEVRTYLQNDVWTSSLRENMPYLRVSYENLNERIAEVAKFIGSSATPDVLSDLAQRPVTLKLPTLPATELIANVSELDPIFEAYEQLREHLVGDSVASE
jgi:hypothetical protein